ncbi:hypothetical protein PWR05_10085 [Paraburkholderia sp. A2RI-6]|uniref:hypothetical protein n=1 Tax=Paraburkholderia sp. A2RI-6 TaxID=3028371 RepID=UPI003B7770C1
MQLKDLMLCHASPAQPERGRRSQHLVLEPLLLEQPAQQNHLACGLEGPELRRALERAAIEDLPAAVMER